MFARKLGEIGSNIYRSVVFPFIRCILEIKTHSVMKQHSYVNKGTVLRGNNFIGKNTVLTNVDMGFGTFIQAESDVSNAIIGKYCSIAPGFCTVGGNHNIRESISSHPCFYSVNNVSQFSYVNENSFEENKYVDNNKRYCVEIGNDVWIGSKVLVCQGIRIGDGAVIGAGALVNRDIEPYAIYAGVPAKKIGMRFTDEKIQKLVNMKWWDKDESWIKEHASDFSDVEEFINKYCD